MKIDDDNMTRKEFDQRCQQQFGDNCIPPNADVYSECIRARGAARGQVTLKVVYDGERGTVYQVADENIVKALVGIRHDTGQTFNYGDDYELFQHDVDQELYGSPLPSA